MNPVEQIKLQQQIKESSEDLQFQMKELYNWEKRMKEKEKKAKENPEDADQKMPPIRSQVDHESLKLLKENTKQSHWKSKADQFKIQGNEHMKSGDFEKATLSYTKAIELYDKEPIYYSNRSLCHIKLQKFNEAVSDCDKALKLDGKYVKAFYRRMLANEGLGFTRLALEDCLKVLEIDPKNTEALNCCQRLKNVSNETTHESEKLSKENIKENDVKTNADHFKNQGNDFLKSGNYEKAASLYSEAIKLYNKDPFYFTNRSLCFIKLEKFDEAISDCDKAIELDDKCVKAYYRRMQANECLGLAKRALEDCQKVIEIDPKNSEAKASFQRINQRIKRYDKSKVLTPIQSTEDFFTPSFTKPSDTLIKVDPIDKPAHLRSKKPLKRVDINEFIEAKTTANYSNIQVSDEIIDYLFNTGECGSFVKEEPPKKPKLDNDKIKVETPSASKSPSSNSNSVTNSKSLLETHQLSNATSTTYRLPEMPPKSTAEFHANWKDLSLENKFKYLKSIAPNKLTSILGAGFESDHLSDILKILSTFYVEENLEPQNILGELCKHNEISILVMFMDELDKNDAISKQIGQIFLRE
ncbi:RPAP3 family protein [Megaselia abdita]